MKTGEKEPPTILEPLKCEVVKEGEPAVLTCQITGTPTPKITWMKDGKPVGKNVSTKTIGDTHSIILVKTTSNDTGDYTVAAKNDHGSAETTATVVVEGEHFLYGISVTFSLNNK